MIKHVKKFLHAHQTRYLKFQNAIASLDIIEKMDHASLAELTHTQVQIKNNVFAIKIIIYKPTFVKRFRTAQQRQFSMCRQ
jgi:hypothetical protein